MYLNSQRLSDPCPEEVHSLGGENEESKSGNDKKGRDSIKWETVGLTLNIFKREEDPTTQCERKVC